MRSHDVTCFKCLGKGNITSQCLNCSKMIMKDNGEIESIKEPQVDSNPVMEKLSDMEYPVEVVLLVAKRVLTSQVQEENLQRENIFHT